MTDQRERRRRAARLGAAAETLCAWRLRLAGYRVLARGWRVPVGEIDLVACRGAVIAFVEVKARSRHDDAVAALDRRKRERVARAAAMYLARHPASAPLSARFDVMVVLPWPSPRCLWPLHLVDAWRPGLA